MKKYLATFFFLFISCFAFSQKLTKELADSLKMVLDRMVEEDQKWRTQLTFSELDSTKLDSIEKLPSKERWAIPAKMAKEKPEIVKQIYNSLWPLQDEIDSLNKARFLEIIKKYGFPSYNRVGTTACGILTLHMMGEKDFNELLPLFQAELKKGNMSANDYANWYDRNQLFMNKKKLYGVYDSNYPCVENIKKTNKARKKIGLHKLYKENKCHEKIGIAIE